MYPSGVWRGYWDQVVFGRQLMNDLNIHFDQGKVTGHGKDIVGQFTLSGSYDHLGKVQMIKQYVDRHQVEYSGEYDGEGTIFGTWIISNIWKGKFAISYQNRTSTENAPIRDL